MMMFQLFASTDAQYFAVSFLSVVLFAPIVRILWDILPKKYVVKRITVYCGVLLLAILANVIESALGSPDSFPVMDIRLFLPLAVYLLISDEYIWALPVFIVIPYIIYPPSAIDYHGIIYRFVLPIVSIGTIYLLDKALAKRRFILRFFLSAALIVAAGLILFVTVADIPEGGSGRLVIGVFGIYAETAILIYAANALYGLYKEKESERKKYTVDELTGLYTGIAFKKLCERELAKHKNKPAVLFMLDIDNMNFYNNNYGHEIGNMCIAMFSNRLKEFVELYPSSIAGRLSGDTMVVFVQPERENASIDDLMRMFDKKTQNIKLYIENNLELTVTAAMGMAVYGRDAKNLDELMDKADFAMREAKKSGSRKIALFDETSYQEFKKITSIAGSISSIINERMFSHVYQAIVSVETCEVAIYEALSRPHPSLNVNINTLLEISQSIHKRMELEKEMLLSIIEDYKWHGKLNIELSINESLYSLYLGSSEYQEKFESLTSNMLITIELTEDTRLSFGQLEAKIESIRKIGHKIALDDFGAQNTNELALLVINPDYIKISMELIRDIEKNTRRYDLVSNLINYAHRRGIRVIAECIETEEEMRALIGLGADYLQGYYISMPSPLVTDISDEKKEEIRRYRDEKRQ